MTGSAAIAFNSAECSAGSMAAASSSGITRTEQTQPDAAAFDLPIHDVSACIARLREEPLAIESIVRSVALAAIDRSWSAVDSDRLYALSKWCLRHGLNSRTDHQILAAQSDAWAFCAQAVRSLDQVLASQLAVVADVLDEHLRAQKVAAPERVLKMAHVESILELCEHLAAGSEQRGWIPRKALLAATGLKAANLTRIMSWLVAANLVEQKERGQQVLYRLGDAWLERRAKDRRVVPTMTINAMSSPRRRREAKPGIINVAASPNGQGSAGRPRPEELVPHWP